MVRSCSVTFDTAKGIFHTKLFRNSCLVRTTAFSLKISVLQSTKNLCKNALFQEKLSAGA